MPPAEVDDRYRGKIPEELLLLVIGHSLLDKSRAPEGKCSALTEQMALPANVLTEREWLEFKKSHADAVIEL